MASRTAVRLLATSLVAFFLFSLALAYSPTVLATHNSSPIAHNMSHSALQPQFIAADFTTGNVTTRLRGVINSYGNISNDADVFPSLGIGTTPPFDTFFVEDDPTGQLFSVSRASCASPCLIIFDIDLPEETEHTFIFAIWLDNSTDPNVPEGAPILIFTTPALEDLPPSVIGPVNPTLDALAGIFGFPSGVGPALGGLGAFFGVLIMTGFILSKNEGMNPEPVVLVVALFVLVFNVSFGLWPAIILILALLAVGGFIVIALLGSR